MDLGAAAQQAGLDGEGPNPALIQFGKCDSAVLLLKLPGVWPVTGAARVLRREPQCKQWLYKVSREDTRGGKEFHTGGGKLGSLGR